MIEKSNISADGNHHLDESKKQSTQNYVALFRMGYAIGINAGDWEVATHTKLCNRQTTIGEIVDWYKSILGEKVKLSCEIVEAE